MQKSLLTTDEAEQLTGIHRRRLIALAGEGKLHPLQTGPKGRYAWPAAELQSMQDAPALDYERLADMVAERVAQRLAIKIVAEVK